MADNKKEPIKLITINFYLHEDGQISQETLKASKLSNEDFNGIIDKWYELVKASRNGKTN